MNKDEKCGIPSYNVGECDKPWGHEGEMHSNAGDGFYARDHEEEHKRRQLIVGPNAKTIPLTAELVDVAYRLVTKLTLPQMEWPPYIRWRGRIFGIYHETRALPVPEEMARKQGYREIEIWDAHE